MTANHQRQPSYPPPYESYSYHDDESISPTTTTLPQPYLSNDNIYEILPHYTSLPAFNSPRRYSRRLRRLVETREKSLFLKLQLPAQQQQQQSYQQLAVVDLDEKSANASSADLLGGLPCDEESQYTHHNQHHHHSHSRRRRSSTGDDKELSWWTFAGLAAVLFMVVASCSVFVGWSTGLFEGNGGLVTHMRYSHSSVTTVWGTSSSPLSSSSSSGAAGSKLGDVFRSRVETMRTEGYLLGDADEQTSVLEKVRTKPLAHGDIKQAAREEVQKRTPRRRKGPGGH